MVLLSANGMLRTILILLIVWQLLRLFMRMQQPSVPRPPQGPRWAPPEQRPPGEVRIEQVQRGEQRPGGPDTLGPVQDADFEEIK